MLVKGRLSRVLFVSLTHSLLSLLKRRAKKRHKGAYDKKNFKMAKLIFPFDVTVHMSWVGEAFNSSFFVGSSFSGRGERYLKHKPPRRKEKLS